MGELINLEEYRLFRDASARARGLAMAHGDSAWVRRTDAGWKVAVRPAIAKLLVAEVGTEDPLDAPYYHEETLDAYDDYQHEVEAELMEELEEDRDNWARSDEEGWFYGDE